MRVEVIVPKGAMFDIEKFKYRNRVSSTKVAKEAKRLFDSTTRSWSRRPKFYIKDSYGSDFIEIGTDDELYAMINDGVPAHVIIARGGRRGVMSFQREYSAKTSPRVIGSRSGGKSGNVVTTNFVWHPGIDPREFADEIMKRTDKMFIDLKIGDIVEANR